MHSEWYSCSNTLCVHLLSLHFCTRKYRQRSTILHAKNESLTDLSCWIKIAVTPHLSVRNPHGPEHITNYFLPLIQKQPICNSDWYFIIHETDFTNLIICFDSFVFSISEKECTRSPCFQIRTKLAHDMVLCFPIVPQSPVWLMSP